MASPLEMYSKDGLANWICSAKWENWSKNGQWPTVISSSVIGIDVIRTNIIEEVKKAELHFVLADEVSSHNIEHLPICVRFVDGDFEIREDFIGYVKLE